MITGKIILKSGTKLTLNERFGEIAKQAPPPPHIQQQTSVIISKTRQELFGNKPSVAVNIANRLKKRSINYRLRSDAAATAMVAGASRPFVNRRTQPVFQRLGYGNRRRGGGAASFIYGGQSGIGLRLRGGGRVETRIFRSRTRGFFNNNSANRFGGFSKRGNTNNRGQRFGNRFNRGRLRGNSNFNRGRGNNNFNRGRGNNNFNRGRGNNNFNRGRGNNQNQNRNINNNTNISKEMLDNDIDQYMAKNKLDSNSMDMSAV